MRQPPSSEGVSTNPRKFLGTGRSYNIPTKSNNIPRSDLPQDGGENEERPDLNEEKLTIAERDAVVASIHSTYLDEAAKEDKMLVEGWTETLNIILTFGGLLSAVITAFLLVVQPDLKPEPNRSTNEILLSILKTFDNSTSFPTDRGEAYVPSPSTLRILAWWHCGLGCSITSTFGALLSKQWVIHYQSKPYWANTEVQKSRLREARFGGLEKWKMEAIIECLPIVLQLAVFFFYLGLAESVRSTSALFAITVSFAVVMASLFVFPLLMGALFPACPYKSLLTTLANTLVDDARFWCGEATSLARWVVILATTTPFNRYSDFREEMTKYWKERTTHRIVEEGMPSILGDEALSAGILCWWLQAPHLWKGVKEADLDDVVDVVMESSVGSVMATRSWKRNFESWSLRVFRQLRSPSPSRFHRLQADTVCHFVHHSAHAKSSVKLAIQNSMDRNIVYESTDVYICKAIRNGWAPATDGSMISTPLPIAKMYPTTFAVYLHYQLADWGSEERDRYWNRELLLQELPVALAPGYFENTDIFLTSVIEAISLSAIALVPSTLSQDIPSAKDIASSEPLEQLLRAIHRLSYFSEHTRLPDRKYGTQSGESMPLAEATEAQKRLVAMATLGAGRVFRAVLQKGSGRSVEEVVYVLPSWRNGSFAGSLSRLMKLGHTWWYGESIGGYPKPPGATMIYELHRIILQVLRKEMDDNLMAGIGGKVLQQDHQQSYADRNLQETIIPSTIIIEEILATYAHPSPQLITPESDFLTASLALDYALGLRYYRKTPRYRSFFFKNGLPPCVTLSRTPVALLDLTLYPQVVRQLIENIDNETHGLGRLSLSIIVKGRDVFFPPQYSQPSRLTHALDSLFGTMFHSNNLLQALPVHEYAKFDQIPELVSALESRANQLGLRTQGLYPNHQSSPAPPTACETLTAGTIVSASH